MSAMTAQNIKFCPLIAHPVLPFMRHKESFFKMKPLPEPLEDEMSQSTITDDLLERIGITDIEYDEPSSIDPSQLRVSRHLSGGGLLLENKSSYELSTNPFKNKLRLILAKEDQRSSTNPFTSSSLVSENSSECSKISARRNTVSQATQTANEVAWLIGDQSEQDLICLQKSIKGLSLSGWYYENVSWKDSITLLQNTEPGTFFVRDSADPNFLFSLSVQTVRGPTSVRLHYVNGRFRLDAEANLIPTIPSFENVIELVEYYVANTGYRKRKDKSKRKHEKEQVWIDLNGQVYSNILLSKPLIKDKRIFKLQHLCRLKVNSIIRNNVRHTFVSKNPTPNLSFLISHQINCLRVPQYVKDFLNEYPYSK